jgi:hypothetical protein
MNKVKQIVLLIFFLSLNYVAHSQIDKDIYVKIVNDFILNLRQSNLDYSLLTTITVLDYPVSMDSSLNIRDYPRFKEKYKNLDKQTFLNFIEKSKSSLQFGEVIIPKIELVILKKESIPSSKELSLKYPKWIRAIIELSNIGFNEAKNQAIVYYGFFVGQGLDGGAYIIYEKRRKKWKKKGLIRNTLWDEYGGD